MSSSSSQSKSANSPRMGNTGGPNTVQRVPSRWRTFVLTLLGVYPLITAILYVVLPLARSWQIWQTTLLVAPVMVTIMIFWMIPFIQKNFSGFILVSARK